MTSTSEFARTLNAKMEQFPENVILGKNEHGVINLRRPSFDCDWYWGFGYLGNRIIHYHLSGIGEGENINFHDALTKHFGDSFIIKDGKDIWQFAEIVQSIYTLKKAAELFHLGGAHYTTNPDAEMLKKSDWEREINEVLIPQQIASMYKILAKYA